MPKRDPKKGRPAMAIQEKPLISPAMKTKMQREAGERQVKLYLKASQGEPGAEAEFRKVYGIPSRQYPHKYVPKTQSGNVLKDLPPELIKSTTGQRVKSEIDFPRTDMRNKNFVNPLTTYLAPHITNPELKKAMDKIQLAPIEMVLPIPGLEVMGKIPSAFKAVKNLTKQAIRQAPKPAWQMQKMPGLHLKSTMEGQAISKIVEPKTGLVNVEQALAIIGKESGGAEKVAMIRKGLGDKLPQKMDFNEFRKVTQDQLIPLERQLFSGSRFSLTNTPNSSYGLKRLYENPRIQKESVLENQTLILGNKSKFGRGSSAHGNPEETLGHAHFLRDAETPDVLTVTQIQSDAFQGTHNIMPRGKLTKMEGEGVPDTWKGLYKNEKGELISPDLVKNLEQKQLLYKNHQERYLQEIVDYAGKRGDVNKVRLPTSETAAKVQGYSKLDPEVDPERIAKIKKQIEQGKKRALEASPEDKIKWERGIKTLELELQGGYEFQHQTILKKYSEKPKTIKNLFGEEPKIVTDNKGNTWYEFDIPKAFKEGKGEIKAFSTIPAAIGTGAAKKALNKDDFATGGMIPKRNRKYQDGGEKGEKPLYDSLDHKQSYYLHDDITRLFNDWNYYKKFQEAGWPIELVSEAIKRNQDKWQRFDKDPMRFEENMIGHRMDKFVPDSLSKFVENKDLESLLRYGHSVVQESKPTDMRQKIEGMKSGGMKKAKGKYMKGGKKGYNTGGLAEQIAALLAKQSEEQKQGTRLSGITDAATMGADMIAGQLAQSAQADLADLDYRVDPEASMRKANRKNIAGSMLSTTAKGAAAGTKIGGPGIGTLIGAGAGLVFSGASALFGKGQRDKEIKEAKNQRAGVLSNLYAGAMESQSFKKGGKVKGKGGPKEDNIEMKVPDGSFIVPAENAEEAMEIGMAYLDWNEETIAERNMGGSKINISNGEVVFAPEEVEMLKMYGVDLDALAPNAPPERQMEQEPGMEQMPGMEEMEEEIPAFNDGGGKKGTSKLTKQEKREEREAHKKWMAENNMLTTGQKLARFAPEIVGALQSSAGLVGLATAKKMPDPVVSLELKKILSETAKLKEQGLDPRTKNIALKEIEKNRRSAMNAIIARGGTTSDIMSGMRDITSGTLSSVERIIDADETIRKGNRAAYLDALMKIGTRKDLIRDQKAQRIKDRSDAYRDLFSAGLENIAGSRRFRGLKDIYEEESDKPSFTFPGKE